MTDREGLWNGWPERLRWLGGGWPWRRALVGAVVGGGLVLVARLVLLLGARSGVAGHLPCDNAQPYGCLGLALLGIAALELALLVLPWPLLHAARVRPAWQPALLGALGRLLYVTQPVPGLVWAVLLPAATYAGAVLATSKDVRGRWRLLAAAVVLLGIPLFASWLTGSPFPGVALFGPLGQ